MLAAVMSAALATPSPANCVVPKWPMIAESANRNRGSATRARNAGTASRRISRCWLRDRSARRFPLLFIVASVGGAGISPDSNPLSMSYELVLTCLLYTSPSPRD